MKKNLMFAMFGAIALTGAVGLSSCSDEEVAEVNPNYNPETGEVMVDFALNVSTNSPTTRMPATTVQEGTAFRGIQKALLLTFKQASDGSYVTTSSTVCDKSYNLDQLIAADGLNSAGPKSRRVLEMSLPTGTNTLMFWGKAIKTPNANTYDADSYEGSITFSPNKTLSSASFKLTPCLDDTEKANLLLYEKIIETVLTKIVQSEGTFSTTLGDQAVSNKTLKWSDYVDFTPVVEGEGESQKTVIKLTPKEFDPATYNASDASHEPMSALGMKIANLFVTLNTFGDNELRNGEGRMIEVLVNDIYAVMGEVKAASATTIEEKVAQLVANKIQSNISSYFDVSSGTCSWKDITSDYIELAGLTPSDFTAITTDPGDLGDFPDGIFRLPPGATILTYTALDGSTLKNEYHYMSTVPTYAMGAGDSFNPFNYMYPAELCYFGNSPIRVTSDTHAVSDYPDGSSTWDDDNEWKKDSHNNTVDWTKNGHVLSSTRSVAMQDNINYGTAMLATTIKYEEGVTELYDNNKGLHPDENPNKIDYFDGMLELTGVLIGGQTQEVGWNYLPVGENPFTTMVYDNTLPSTAIPTPTGKENYTLVWDNWNESLKGQKQNIVYVALQFTNKTGKDFWGQNNIIRNNSTFYIVGTLDPDAKPSGYSGTDSGFAADKSLGVSWPTKYALPPYDDTDGSSVKERRVFIQDYKTTANFVIGANSLKYALVSVPDLRSNQMTLGLSVDLSWSQGLTFDNVVIGGTE